MEIPEKLRHFPSTNAFRVIDTIGVPHPYCIGTRHVVHASDNFNNILSKECIEDGELNHRIMCEVEGCNLEYFEHEQALLIEVEGELNENEALQVYLKGIADLCEAGGYVGFAFIEKADVE